MIDREEGGGREKLTVSVTCIRRRREEAERKAIDKKNAVKL